MANKQYTKGMNAEERSYLTAHGLTNQDIEDLAYQQANGIVRMMRGNKNPEYIMPYYERFHFHVEVEHPLFDQKTGARLSTPKIQKPTKIMFERKGGHKESWFGDPNTVAKMFHDPNLVDEDNSIFVVPAGNEWVDCSEEDSIAYGKHGISAVKKKGDENLKNADGEAITGSEEVHTSPGPDFEPLPEADNTEKESKPKSKKLKLD